MRFRPAGGPGRQLPAWTEVCALFRPGNVDVRGPQLLHQLQIAAAPGSGDRNQPASKLFVRNSPQEIPQDMDRWPPSAAAIVIPELSAQFDAAYKFHSASGRMRQGR